MTDLDGAQVEVMEFGPESSQRKAMDAWKSRAGVLSRLSRTRI
jgi:hypothetical protein